MARAKPQVDHRQLALELAALFQPRPQARPTLAELARRLLPGLMAGLARPDDLEIAWRLHILPRLGEETEDSLSLSKVSEALGCLGLSARSHNKTRWAGGRLIERARVEGLWSGQNPFRMAPPRKLARRAVRVLTPRELARLLEAVRPGRHCLFATAVLTGARKGELLAIRRSDVELSRGLLHLRGSNRRRVTKNGEWRTVPIHDQLAPILEQHMRTQTGEWLFPSRTGKQLSAGTHLERELRSALGRAGIVEAFFHKCRRCGTSERHQDDHRRICDGCGMRLWLSPIPAHMRFHDLRHTTTTLLQEAGVPRAVVKMLVGHRSGDITDVYTHHTEAFVRAQLNRLKLPLESESPFVSTPDLRTSNPKVAGSIPAGRVPYFPIRAYRSPAQVAEMLGVCRDTVYRLIHQGPLVARRVGGLLRIHDDDLEAFMAARPVGGGR